MRYAIISDIHSNYQALKAVLTDIRSYKVDEIICLGDIVGYGPNPGEVLKTAYSNIHHFILGNHDAVIAGKLSPHCFNKNARKIILWTKSLLDKKAVSFFRKMPLLLKGPDFICAHGEFTNPGRYGYIIEREEARAAFKTCRERILFTGHSHVPGIYVVDANNRLQWVAPQNFSVEKDKRYIVNVGSVGQPRNEDIRASYCLYDLERQEITFRQIPFDIEAYRAALKQKKLPESSSSFLGIDNETTLEPVRELTEFQPVSEQDEVKTAADEKNLEKAVNRLKKTRQFLIVAVIILTSLALFLIYISVNTTFANADKKVVITSASSDELLSDEHMKPGDQLISMPSVTGPVNADNPIENWKVVLSDPVKQKLSIVDSDDEKHPELTLFQISSNSLENISLTYVPVAERQQVKYNGKLQFKGEKCKKGFFELVLKKQSEDGTESIMGRSPPKGLKDRKRWTIVSVTTDKTSPDSEQNKIIYTIQGKFIGNILIRKCSLNIKQ